MIPAFAAEPTSALAPVLPPAGFIPAIDVLAASFALSTPSYAAKPFRASRPGARNGQRYEEKIQRCLVRRFGSSYLASPWIKYTDRNGLRCCQPDGLLDLGEVLVVVEIKFRHCVEAWYQLRQRYEPVVRVLYPERRLALLEICRVFDPTTAFPETFNIIGEPDDIAKTGEFEVLPWRK